MKLIKFLVLLSLLAAPLYGAATDAHNLQITQRNAAGSQWTTRYLSIGSQITTWGEFQAAVGAGGSGDLTEIQVGLALDVTSGTGPIPMIDFDPTELTGSRTWGDGSTDTFVWTFNRATGTDPTITFGNGSILLPALTLTIDLALAEGGTGASDATGARANLGLGSSDSPTFSGLTVTDAAFSQARVWTRQSPDITTTLALLNTDGLVEVTFTDQAAAITLPATPAAGRRIIVIGHNTDAGGPLVISIPNGLYNPNRDTDTATSSTTLTIPASSAGTFLLSFTADDTGWLLYESVGDTYASAAPLDATYITQTANGSLTAEQALGALSTGIMRVATTTGAVTALTTSAGIFANISDESGTDGIVGQNSPTFTDDILLSTAGVLMTGDGDGAITFLGAGDGNDENLILNLDDGTANTVSLSSGTGVTSVDTGTVGFDLDSATTRVGAFQTADTKLLNQALSAYGAGTAYALTNTAAAIDLGTTDPVKVIDSIGTYLIFAQVHLTYTGATVATETATIKVRRTNNTAADLSAVVVIDLPSSTVVTNSYGVIQIPPFTYTTAATDDSLTIFANVSAALSAGTIDATAIGTSILAVRLY